jgi:hypothetical protein
VKLYYCFSIYLLNRPVPCLVAGCDTRAASEIVGGGEPEPPMDPVSASGMEKLIDPSRQDGRCDKCTDERKDQPMLGMTIMRNVKAAGDGI